MPFEFIQISANGQRHGPEKLIMLLRDGIVATARRGLVSMAEKSFRACCIEFFDGAISMGRHRPGALRVCHKEVFSETEITTFSRLRDPCRAVPDKDATPFNSIFTNGQLPAMVTEPVGSVTDLKKISGVAAARAGGCKSVATRHEPGEPGRQLKQHRNQHACAKVQQQRSDEYDRPHRIPFRPEFGTAAPEGASGCRRGLKRLTPRLSRDLSSGKRVTATPPGVRSAADAVSRVFDGTSFSLFFNNQVLANP